MNPSPPSATRSDTLCPTPTLFRSGGAPSAHRPTVGWRGRRRLPSTEAGSARGPMRPRPARPDDAHMDRSTPRSTPSVVLLLAVAAALIWVGRGEATENGPSGNPIDSLTSVALPPTTTRSEEHTSELQSLMRISYAVFCLKKKKQHKTPRKIQIK